MAQRKKRNGSGTNAEMSQMAAPDSEALDVAGHQDPGFGDVASDPLVHQDQHDAGRGIRQREGRRGPGGSARDRGCQQGDRHDLAHRQEPVDQVVGVVAVGVEGEAGPQPPQGNEVAEVRGESGPRRVFDQPDAEDGDGNDEDEVVEELEPGGRAIAALFGGAEAGWLDGGKSHGRDLGG